MNKALDYNKLQQSHNLGRLLKKLPLNNYYVSKKLDGHYTSVVVHCGTARYYTSSGKEYWPETTTWLDSLLIPQGVYICERIVGEGKLGDRVRCALIGPRSRPVARADSIYMVHDYISLEAYKGTNQVLEYQERRHQLKKALLRLDNYNQHIVEESYKAHTIEEARAIMSKYVKSGYEGIILKHPTWRWQDTNSRTVPFMKWKARPTADLLCVNTTEGEGKYEGKIGALVLQDSEGRLVMVGSGLTDMEREADDMHFVGSIIEIEYEQIIDTYIQPTYIGVRHDKTSSD